MAHVQSRINFSSTFAQADCPDFLDIQIKSFRDFFQIDTKPENRSNEGLFKTFNENFPITDSRNQFVLEFIDYFVDPPPLQRDGMHRARADLQRTSQGTS